MTTPSAYSNDESSPWLQSSMATTRSAQAGRRRPLLPYTFAENLPLTSRSERWKRRSLSHSWQCTLDRVNVLGDHRSGHTGCVNALSWAQNGQYLLSAGDDTTVRLWRMDTTDTTTHYPFFCESIIRTDHRDNIFNARMLPYSTRIATVSADKEIRIFDIEGTRGRSLNGRGTVHSLQSTCGRVLRCHADRVKRIITEDSPDKFLTVSEDGQVRQHDLRTPHTCRSGCPAPLIKMGHELSTLSLSQLTPYQFVVAGESPYGYLFDRRKVGRFLQEEWGVVTPANDEAATCVRRFGRPAKASVDWRCRSEHIFGARMSESNGHEVLLSYMSDAVYLFSTRDDPTTDKALVRSQIIPPNRKGKLGILTRSPSNGSSDTEAMDEEDSPATWTFPPDNDHSDEEDDEEDDEGEEQHVGICSKAPLILPRRRFAGACNVQTVKDVNFLGPDDEYVTSGSDDGNLFLWRKATGDLHGIFEGDSSTVNVIEGHPHLPLVAVSGLDTTIKLFAPVHGASAFSKMGDATNIIQRNAESTRQAMVRTADIARLFRLHYRQQLRGEGDGEIEPVECTYQ